MAPTDTHELTHLVADLALLADALIPAAAPGPISAPPSIAAAHAAFDAAWRTTGSTTTDLHRLSTDVAAAGMAYLEGDPATAHRIVTALPEVA